MNESNDKQDKFLGAYFDRDGVLRLSRWADVFSWVTLTVYVLTWLGAILLYLSQYLNGMMGDKGITFLMVFNMFSPYFTQVFPGVFFFFGLQGISKGLLLILDIEDNTRRTARK
jgi:hypothetical protein